MKELALNNGMVTMVDDEDYEYLSVHRWHAFRCRKTWYVIRSCSRKERPRRSIYMYYLGMYDDPAEAAKAYDRKARELHGEFAKVNFE